MVQNPSVNARPMGGSSKKLGRRVVWSSVVRLAIDFAFLSVIPIMVGLSFMVVCLPS